jgi:hypothetical protein
MIKLSSILNKSRKSSKFYRNFSTANYVPSDNQFSNILMLGSAIIVGIGVYTQMKDVMTDVNRALPKALEDSEIKTLYKNNFVRISRKSVEKEIYSAMTAHTGYHVVYGPKGNGKSEVVQYVAMDRKGVVKLDVHSALSREEIVADLSRKLLGQTSMSHRIAKNLFGEIKSNIDVDNVIKAIRKANVTPVIIFDVERTTAIDQKTMLGAVRSLAKILSPHCHVIIILSEINDVLEFGYDLNREHFIYIDELTIDEAKTLLRTLQAQMLEKDMQYVFKNIGTCPAMLEALADHVRAAKPVKDFVESYLSQAEIDLIIFPHQQILKALKDHPEGVSPKYFHNIMHNGVNLSDPRSVAGVAMTNLNAVVYHIEEGKYKLASKAHDTALKNYDPIV